MIAFISYSHQDAKMLDLLHKHLAQLQREGLISTWTDNEIKAGESLNEIIADELQRCNLFIALVSPDYIASNYCYNKEFLIALEYQKSTKLDIVPIIVEPCDWLNTPFKDFKALPHDGKAISTWENKHAAFLDCAQNLRRRKVSALTESAISSEVITAEPEFIYSYSLNFPKDKTDEIFRQPVVNLIDRYFTNGKNVIFLEGDEDTGKTTILKQFVKLKYKRAFSSFLNPINKVSSGTEQLLSDLCLQLHWYIYEVELRDISKINLPYYQTLLFELKRKKRKANDLYYFVIDGLPHDAKKYVELIEFTFDILPLGVDGYKFLFSGDFENYKPLLPENNKIISTPLGLQNFSEEETIKYFKDTQIGEDDASILWKEAAGGIPGKLANFKRLMVDERISVNELLDRLESSSVYEYDWIKIQRVSEKDPNLLEILSFIAIDEKMYSVSTLSKITNIPYELIVKSLKSISSITVNDKEEIIFFSNKHKAFFAKKLIQKSNHVYNKNVNYLRSRGNSIETLLDVPTYFEKLNNYNEIVSFISEDYLPKIITECQTLPEIVSKINLGFLAAKKVNKDSDILRFTIQGSLIKSIEGLHIWESELEARIALDDYENAIKLATSALLKEDRLRLLAKVGKQRIKKGLIVDDAILSQLKTLYNEVDLQELGENAVSIAGDLLYCIPELAVNLIQKTAEKEGKGNINDWLLTKLALSSIESRDQSILPKITSILNNDKSSSINSALSFLYSDYNTSQLLTEVKKIEKASNRFFFLRLLLSENRSKKEIELVIDYALEELLKNDSKEVLNTSLLRDLSSNLEHIANSSVIAHLCKKFGDFRDEARTLGPTIEYFKFELNIVKALIKIDYNSGVGLLLSLEKETYLIKDLLTKTECLALLKDLIGRLRGTIESKKVHLYIIRQVDSGLDNSLQLLLKSTSDHYDVLSDIVRTISTRNPEFGGQVSWFANTHYRRIRLLALSFTSYVEDNNINILDFRVLNSIYKKIDFETLREDCLRVVLEKAEESKQLNKSTIDNILPIIERIQKIESSEFKCYLNVRALRILYKYQNDYKDQIQKLEKQLNGFWSDLNSDIQKIELGFFIASDLSDVNRRFAEDILAKAKTLKDGIWPDSMNTIEIYANTIKLLIRIFVGFVQSKVSSSSEFEKIETLISNIPSNQERIYLWSYFSRFLLINNEQSYFQKILKEYLKPLYNGISDTALRTQIFVSQLSDVFYVQNSSSTLKQIKLVPIEFRDIAYDNILSYLVYENHLNESYEDSEQYKTINHDDAESIIELLDEVVSDSILYNYINRLCKAIQSKRTLTDLQKKSVVRKLGEIIDRKLPNKTFIEHNGFLIVSKAQLLRVDKQLSKDQNYIQALITKSNSIDNLSDRAYVKALLAEVINPIKEDIAKNLLKESLQTIKSIECESEYIERINHLSPILRRIDISLWKECLMNAVQKSTKNVKENVVESQRSLIDIAYKYDASFARDLIAHLDRDQIREQSRKSIQIKRHYNILELKNKIVNGIEFSVSKKAEYRAVGSACGMALAELNSALIVAKAPEKMRNVLDVAIKLPLRESFPIFEFYFQNIVTRVKTSNDAKQYLSAYFTSCYTVCKVVETLSMSAKERSLAFLTKRDVFNINQSTHLPESKESAMSYIRKWLSENGKDYVIIHDPYFNKEQLDILKLILDVAPEVEVEILTSVSPQNQDNSKEGVGRIYSDYWKTICHQEPPFTKIIVCFTRETKTNPIHDRWILTNGSGLTLGTSLNSLGNSKESTIMKMTSSEADYIENEVLKKYLLMKAREFKNEKLDYIPFPLT